MSNGINSRQNEERSIQMLAARREIDNITKKILYGKWVLSVAVPFILSFLYLFSKCERLNTCLAIVSIISWLVSYKINISVKNKKSYTAIIAQQFDSYVFDMNFDNVYHDDDMDNIIVKYANKHFKKRIKNKEEVINWYCDELDGVDELPLYEGILSCQKLNYRWNINLRKRYFTFCMVIFSIILATIIFFATKINGSIDDIPRVIFILPILMTFLDLYHDLKDDINKLNIINKKISQIKRIEVKQLKYIQNLFYEYRKSCIPIPTLFYEIFKNIDEENVKATIKYEMNNKR